MKLTLEVTMTTALITKRIATRTQRQATTAQVTTKRSPNGRSLQRILQQL